MLKHILAFALLTAPAIADTESVLIPIATRASGAHGSLWTFDLFAHNGNDHLVSIGGLRCADCGVGAGLTARLAVFDIDARAPGIFLGLDKVDLEAMTFQLHVRDISRSANTLGVQIPVVPLSNFSRRINLLNVPMNDHFRETLRIYTPGTAAHVRLTFIELEGPHTNERELFAEEFDIQPPFAGVPGYAQRTDLRATYEALREVKRLRIQIDATVPIWAFATVTSNETQEVTLVSPQP